MLKIVTDSTCDLPAQYYEQLDISVVPINIQFGTETFLDGVTIDPPTFYRKIEETGTLPKTSQPSAGQFEEHYRRLAGAGVTEIISIHVTARLSGTVQSAEVARDLVADRVRVYPFDSACGSAALGFMVREAARLAAAGKPAAEILSRLEQVRPAIGLALTVQDLRFAQMSGRVGRLQSSLSSLLNIKPIILLEDGQLDVAEKVRTTGKALARMIEILARRFGPATPVNLAAVHALAPAEGRQLLDQATPRFACRDSFVADLALSLAVQFGPGTLGLIVYPV